MKLNLENLCKPEEIAHYTCYRTRTPLAVDGKLSEAVWHRAQKSPRFVDAVGGNPGIYDTRSALLWDEQNLYIAFWMEEPYVSAEITKRDDLIFTENDIEVFIDGGDCYYEFEMNALGTLYEVFFIWKDAFTRGSKFDVPEWDVHSRQALTFGGNHDRSDEYFWHGAHPRGVRWAYIDYDMPGVQAGVHIDGKLNDSTEPDKGWQVCLAFPWQSLSWLADGRSLPPRQGDVWRLFFARYEKFFLNGEEAHAGWSWNKIGIADNHNPEYFTRIHFDERCIEDL